MMTTELKGTTLDLNIKISFEKMEILTIIEESTRLVNFWNW